MKRILFVAFLVLFNFIELSAQCSSAPAQPQPISGLVAVCQGNTGLVYSVPAVANATSYNWFFPDNNWEITAGVGTNSVTVRLKAGASTGNVYVSANNACGTGNARYDKWVVVSAPTVAGTVTPANTNVCSASNSTNLSLNGHTGNILRWESSLDNFGGGAITTINSTGSPITASNVTVDTYYRAVVQNGGCNLQYSNSVKITVYGSVNNPGPISMNGVPYSANGSTDYCSSSSVVFSISPVTNATTYAWTTPPGWTLISGQGTTTATYTTGNSAQSQNVSVSASNSSICNSSGSSYLYLYLGNTPQAAVINSQSTSGQTKCSGLSYLPITINASGTGLTYQWYSNNSNSNSGGTSLGSSNGAQTSSYTPQSNIVGTLYYYCIVRGCSGNSITSAVSGAFVTSSAPNATISYLGNPFCRSITVAQSVSQNGTTGGTYSAPTGLTINASTGAINPSTSTAGSYTVTYTYGSGACAGLTTTTSITITAVPTASISYSGSPFCKSLAGSQLVLQNGTSGGTYTASAGLTINSSTGAITPSTSTAGSYTVTYTYGSGGCSGLTTTTSVVINDRLATPGSITQPTNKLPNSTGNIFSIAAVANAVSYTWSVTGTGWAVTANGTTTSATITIGSGTGTVSVTATNACGTSAASTTGNITPIVPTAPPTSPTVTTINISCTVPTGQITFTSPAPAAKYTYTVVGTNPVVAAVTNTTGIFSGLTAGNYNAIVNDVDTGLSSGTTATINSIVTTTWNGTFWNNGDPTKDKLVVINANYTISTTTGDLNACSLTINTGFKLTVQTDRFLIIQNDLTVNGTLDVLDKGSLVMVNDTGIVKNNGTTTIHRFTTEYKKLDYVYWSTPVTSTTIGSTFWNWRTDRAFEYNNGWNYATAMLPAKGYIITVPNPVSSPSPSPTPMPTSNVTEVVFQGQVNNGEQKITNVAPGNYYLIGNPYPSALDANAFLNHNSGALDGTIYFWTHNTAIQLASDIKNGTAGSGAYAFTSDDYASYNLVGGVGTSKSSESNSSLKPTGNIASCQGFFAMAKPSITSTEIVFNNAMRLRSGATTLNNSNFFRTKNSKTKEATAFERHRIWLNLSNKEGAFKQTLIGYVTEATNENESRFDGETMDGNAFVDFYSVNENKNLVIQGRALPFDDTDEVAVGFKSAIAGEFNISIDEVDGILANQAVFLEDKLTHTEFDLKKGNYTFKTEKGTFNERFVLKYKSSNETLGTGDFEAQQNQVMVTVKNKQIKINATETIKNVVIYDVFGKKIYQKNNLDANEISIADLTSSHQVLIVKTSLENGTITTDKIIF